MEITAMHHATLPEARYWTALEGGRVLCGLCPHSCVLKEGQSGLCLARVCREGRLRTLVYGRASGFAVDPMEKKPLHHFLPGTPILSFGTAGCNLSCRFCQNSGISHPSGLDILRETASPEEIARAALENGCGSVAFTYNEPIVSIEYAMDTAKACRERGVRTVAVTAGYISAKPREDFFSLMDAANVDLKSFRDGFYKRLCGASLAPVLETLLHIRKNTGAWLEITNLLIPGQNDTAAELEEMCVWIAEKLGADVPLHFSAFHPSWKFTDTAPTTPDTLAKARAIALENGIYHAYTGNVRNEDGSSTFCPSCGKKVIGRDGYLIKSWGLDKEGRCSCGRKISGVFDAGPGDWGGGRS